MFFLLYYCYKAREKEQEQTVNKEPTPPDTTSEKITARHEQTSDCDNTGESSNMGHYSSFPLLPLPPQEHYYYRHKNQHGTSMTEDKMGTLHNAIIDTKEQPVQCSSSSQTSSHKDKGTEHKLASNPSSAVRFVPRTTHLENRKRKMEEVVEHSLTDVNRKNEPLIGPKLPDRPKLDMEDESLNTTVSLIRSTMKQVAHNGCFNRN